MRRKKQDEGERRKEICLSSATLRETERERGSEDKEDWRDQQRFLSRGKEAEEEEEEDASVQRFLSQTRREGEEQQRRRKERRNEMMEGRRTSRDSMVTQTHMSERT